MPIAWKVFVAVVVMFLFNLSGMALKDNRETASGWLNFIGLLGMALIIWG